METKRRCGRALITRPKEDSEKSREQLNHLGCEVMVEPILEIVPFMGTKPQIAAAISRKPQAVIITSANGVRVLADYVDERDIIILAVGDTSADLAIEKGFKNVESAAGDVKELSKLIKSKYNPEDGFLLHVAGSVVAGDMQAELEEGGFEIRRICAYEARPAEKLSHDTKVAMANCDIDFIIFYSARTAQIFEELMIKENIAYLAKNIEIFSLSPNIKTNLVWKSVYISEQPNEDALLELIDRQTSSKVVGNV
jgi:uroporphyrinogen-III synthase